jgi:hypothetical protein
MPAGPFEFFGTCEGSEISVQAKKRGGIEIEEIEFCFEELALAIKRFENGQET